MTRVAISRAEPVRCNVSLDALPYCTGNAEDTRLVCCQQQHRIMWWTGCKRIGLALNRSGVDISCLLVDSQVGPFRFRAGAMTVIAGLEK
ncbi:hypothetical protein XFF6992_50021 [Xanthomonas citri pv. fuscans]|nr:hypothetical protein XFF6992_50021 [Xanthomonas citri pv. fuscans]SOO32608.1 hypothetical protein XFF6994_200009 [Xanthomonas citri pv. fuscans]